MKSFSIPILFTAFVFGLAACEGGKSKPTLNCAPGQYEERGQCVSANTNCEAHEVWQNGECKPLTCPTGQHADNGQCVASELSLELVSQSACYLPSTGATRLIAQFIARDESGLAVAPPTGTSGDYTTSLLINGESIDVESLLDSDSELLRSDLAMSLVLDSSYSMTQHTPPAFAPMKQAAVALLQNAEASWQSNQSSFYWDAVWFRSKIFRPKTNNAGEPWDITDLNNIPAPAQDSGYTALFKAVDYMVEVHEAWYANNIAAGARDRHVMVVFSDGKDNHSWFADPAADSEGNIGNMLFWDELALDAVPTVAEIRTTSALPNLRIHVLGMGSDVDNAELEAIAEAGNGQYFYAANSNALSDLFAQVERELVTQQSLGVETPLPAGEYNFELRTERASDGATASYSWTQQAGSGLTACATLASAAP